jgi:hypothetical protein
MHKVRSEKRQSELSHYETKGMKDENSSEMAHSNSKFRLKSSEKSMSKKSLPSTPAILGGNE